MRGCEFRDSLKLLGVPIHFSQSYILDSRMISDLYLEMIPFSKILLQKYILRIITVSLCFFFHLFLQAHRILLLTLFFQVLP